MLEELDGKPELADELALFNKLGDLYVKQGNTTAAVEQYETAIEQYADQGFPNNAIALCNKVLRNAPGRTHIYLKLAKLMMQRGFATEAKHNLLEYAERMQKAGKLEDAFHALKEFADLSPDKEEIRLILADQLKRADRGDEAQEQLAKLYQELQESGDDNRARATLEKMRAIDPEYDLDAATPVQKTPSKKQKSSDIVFLDLDADFSPASAPPAPEEPVEEIEPLEVEPTSLEDEAEEPVAAESTDESLEVEPTSLEDQAEEPVVVDADEHSDLGIQTASMAEDVDTAAEDVSPIEGLDVPETFEGEDQPVESLEIEATALDNGFEVPDIEPVEDIPDLAEAAEESEAAEAMSEPASGGLDDLPMLEVPAPEEGIEEVDLEDETETAEVAGPTDDLPMLDVTESESEESESDEVPWLSEPAEDAATDAVAEVADGGGDSGESVEIPGIDMGEGSEEDIEIVIDDIDVDVPSFSEVAAPDISALESAVADDPANPVPHRELGEALIETGDRDRGMEELSIAFDAYRANGDTGHARDVLDEIIRLDPNSVHHHQQRVEIASSEGSQTQIVDALLDLADALLRCEELERARSTYERVLESDSDNERARIALDTLMPDVEEEEEDAAALAESESIEIPQLHIDDLELDEPDLESIEIEVEEPEPESVVAGVYEPEPEDAEAEEPEQEPVEAEPEEPEPETIEVSDVSEEPETVADLEVDLPEQAEVAERVVQDESDALVPEPEPEEVVAEPEPEEAVLEPERQAEEVHPEPEVAETAAEAESGESGGFVDLGALIMGDDAGVKDTRMRIDRDEPEDEEEHDFSEMLSEFKKGIDANIDADDSQAHYDLGVAFKEMGLLDEAIAEFQKALRGSGDRLRTSEALGHCFFEKGQYAVAATVLRRAVESESGGDDDKIGLLYWLGRCEEEQKHPKKALGYYQRVFAIDIGFQDVSDRVNTLTQTSG